MLRILSGINAALHQLASLRSPWETQKRFMGGAKKSMARARKNFAKKLKKEARARVLARREVLPALDKELRKESRMRMLWNVKLILASRTGRVIPSVEFSRLSRDLGFPKPSLFPRFIRQFPGVFRLTNDKKMRSVSWLEFSDRADSLIEQEESIMREYHEPLIVENLRKILMMTPERRLLLSKVALIRLSFWVPDDFRTSIIPKYPELFAIEGGYLELKLYDRGLAVSSRERTQNRMDPQLRKALAANPKLLQACRNPNAFRITLEPHKVMDCNVALRLISFQQLPFPGPYDPVDKLDSRTSEAQKRAVGVCHEFLSLTVEKRAFVEHLARLKRDLLLPEKLEEMLVRFPHIFYVSMRGERRVVFLKEYYQKGELIEKHPLSRIRLEFSRLMMLASLSRKPFHRVEFRGISAEKFLPNPPLPEELVQAAFPDSGGPVQQASELQQRAGGEFHAPGEPGSATDQHGLRGEFHSVSPGSSIQQPGYGGAFLSGSPGSSAHQPGFQRSGGEFHAPAVHHQPGSPTIHQHGVRRSGGEFQAPAVFYQPGPPGFHHSDAPGTLQTRNSPETSVPLEQQGVFLQLGLSSSDEEEEPREIVTGDRGRQQQSLGRKLGILSDDDDSESEKPVKVDPWAGWRKPAPKDGEDVDLVRKIKKRNKKPYWEKRPLDDFNDPFF